MKIEALINAELDRLYPQPTREPDWDDALARSRQLSVTTTTPARHHRREPVLAVAAAAVAAVAVTLALVAPWSGRPGLVRQALAAIGSGRYVHAVFQSRSSTVWWVDLQGPSERPVLTRIESIYDTQSGAYDARTLANGVALDAATTRPDPAISRFTTRYRTALRSGEARAIGAAVVASQPVTVLRFPIRESNGRVVAAEDVAIANATHTPLQITYRNVGARGNPSGRPVIYRVLSVTSTNSRTALPKASPGRTVTGSATTIRQLDRLSAKTMLRRAPVWAGENVGRVTLATIELQRVTTERVGSFRTISSSLGLRLHYRGPAGAVTIEEAAKAERGYGFWTANLGTSGPLPPAGQAVLSCSGCGSATHGTWIAQLRTHDLYVTIQSSNRKLVVATARALTVMR